MGERAAGRKAGHGSVLIAKRHGECRADGSRMRSDPNTDREEVEPTSIISPVSRTPTLIARPAESIVPDETEFQGASPRSSAASRVKATASSVVQE